ncbi:hypothetical protein GCM10027180_05310 [Microbulbifer echini]
MKVELEEYLSSKDMPNRKNGTTSKTMKSATGSFAMQMPQNRTETFEPQIVKKHQAQLTNELHSKITALLTLDNNYLDIYTHIANIYLVGLPSGMINTITDIQLPEL